jgi:hypothetical protein
MHQVQSVRKHLKNLYLLHARHATTKEPKGHLHSSLMSQLHATNAPASFALHLA